MALQSIILLWFVISVIVHPILFKRLANLPAKTQQQYWSYFFCLLFSFGFFLFIRENILSPILFLVISLGILNSLAIYSNWRAVAINLSKTAVFSQIDTIIAITLAYVFLKEIQFLNPLLIIGIILCFAAATIFALSHYKFKQSSKSSNNFALLGWISLKGIIWEILGFLMRYFAVEGVSFSTFLVGWYSGTYLGSLILLRTVGKKRNYCKITI